MMWVTCRGDWGWCHAEVPEILVIIVACKEKVTGVMQPAVDQVVKLCLEVWFTPFPRSSICVFGWKPIASWVDV